MKHGSTLVDLLKSVDLVRLQLSTFHLSIENLTVLTRLVLSFCRLMWFYK